MQNETEQSAAPNDTQAATADTLLGAADAPATEQSGTEPEQAKAEEAPVVPDEYADFVVPEGIEIDADLIGEFKPLAKELGLTQEAAQKLIDLQTKSLAKLVEAQQEAQTAVVTQWRESAINDKEFGGAKLQESIAVANKALQRFGGPELVQYLKESGLGNHPEVIRTFWKIGQAISEDAVLTGSLGGGTQHSDPAKRLYPNLA